MKESENNKKSMGLFATTSIGVGGMIGAGIFSLLGIAATQAGTKTYLAFVLSGIVALFCAYSFGKLGARYPSAGGPTEFLSQGLRNSYLIGTLNLLLWIGYIVVNALYAKAFGDYSAALFSMQDNALFSPVISVLVVLFFLLINKAGGNSVGKTQLALVLVKLVIFIIFLKGAANLIQDVDVVPKAHELPNIAFIAGFLFMAFEGFGLITNAAEDIKDVRKTLPRALTLSVIIVTILYALISISVTELLSPDKIQQAQAYAMAEAASPIFGKKGFILISIAALLATSSAINATLYGGANVSYMMAELGHLPIIFKRNMWQLARGGLIYTTIAVIFLALLFPMERIATAGSLAFLVIYAMVNISHLRLAIETGANKAILWMGIGGCVVGFISLAVHTYKRDPIILWLFLGLCSFSFLLEYYFQNRKKAPRKEMSKRA